MTKRQGLLTDREYIILLEAQTRMLERIVEKYTGVKVHNELDDLTGTCQMDTFDSETESYPNNAYDELGGGNQGEY